MIGRFVMRWINLDAGPGIILMMKIADRATALTVIGTRVELRLYRRLLAGRATRRTTLVTS